MSDAFDPGNEPDSTPQGPGGGDPGGGGGGSAPPGGPPPGGGPLLAMLGKQQPPVTAPGPGNMAHGMNLMTQGHGLIQAAMQNFPPGSPQWKDCHRALGLIAKHMAQTAPDAGVQQTNLLDMVKNVARNAILQKIAQQKGGAGGGPGGPESAMPGSPSPATPLPGA